MRRLTLGFVFLPIISAHLLADDPALGLADLESYRLALNSKSDSSAPLVRFRDLWDHPETYAGRAVWVEGRVARVFRQPKVGDFPPLVEAWVVSPAGDPFCLVFPPEKDGRSEPQVGASIRFSGTFLRRIKYHGGDADRLAPLIVGPSSPVAPAVRPTGESRSWSSVDWIMAVAASLVVALILAGRHLARPDPAPPIFDPPPRFVDEEDGATSAEQEGGETHEVA